MTLRCLAIGTSVHGADELKALHEVVCKASSETRSTHGDTAHDNFHPVTNPEGLQIEEWEPETQRQNKHAYVNLDIASVIAGLEAALVTGDQGRIRDARAMLLALSVCHSTLPSDERRIDLGDKLTTRDTVHRVPESMLEPLNYGTYDATSPDELALVCASEEIGAAFIGRLSADRISIALTNPTVERLLIGDQEGTIVASSAEPSASDENDGDKENDGEKENGDGEGDSRAKADANENTPPQEEVRTPIVTFEILGILPFDSVRKRMTTVVRDVNGDVLALIKGADSTMFDIAIEGQEDTMDMITEQLTLFSCNGLRTLVFGYRVIPAEEYSAYCELCERARQEGVAKIQESLMKAASDIIEKSITLVGCTGIEDELQDDVGKTIRNLREAGVGLWVLTGDKKETAIAVGHSCGILNDETFNAVIDATTHEELLEQLMKYTSFVAADELIRNAQAMGPGDFALTGDVPPVVGSKWKRRNFKWKGLNKLRERPTIMSWDDFLKIMLGESDKKHAEKPEARAASGLTQAQIVDLVCRFSDVIDPGSELSVTGAAENRPAGFGNEKATAAEGLPSADSASNERAAVPPLEIHVTPPPHADGDPDAPFAGGLEPVPEDYPNIPSETNQQDREGRFVEHYSQLCVTVTGHALHLLLESDMAAQYFFALALASKSVIACRVSPSQKADLLAEARRKNNSMVSLSIGDGANDVSMIVAADVGVGIMGKEGPQAANSADFVVSEFRHLNNLLFVHGRENLRRNSLQVYHTIFKNCMFGASDFIFGLFSLMSATDLYNSWLKQLFNVLYCAFGILLYGMFDNALPYEVLMSSPFAYPAKTRDGSSIRGSNTYFGIKRFARWFLLGMFGSAIVIFFPLVSLGGGDQYPLAGVDRELDVHDFGMIVFFIVIVVANIVILPSTNTSLLLVIGACIVNLFFFHLSWGVCPFVKFGSIEVCGNLHGSFIATHSTPAFYWCVFLTTVACLSPLLIGWHGRNMEFPSSIRILKEFLSWPRPDPAYEFDEQVKQKVQDLRGTHNPLGDGRGTAVGMGQGAGNEGTSVVVPAAAATDEKGFAFSETLRNRVLKQRRKFEKGKSKSLLKNLTTGNLSSL
eukprot:GHVU01092147.1.p1 GENE.GHVU01092147.1~~GHVU01092147.1.p1  ORF type:complete len:1101 (+),score=188.46 GHVU01092147.1:2234-5536(+)